MRLGASTTSHLLVSTKQVKNLEEDTKLHMKMLPSTCLVHKRLLHFVSGFRNYAGHILLKESSLGEFKQPAGNVAISCFPKILDCPDILEVFVTCWSEDVVNAWSTQDKRKMGLCMQKAEEYIERVYPVLFSDEFDLTANETASACDDQSKLTKRKELITAALRFDMKKGAAKPKKTIEEMTTFKPFNVRELQFEVWDLAQASRAIRDQIMQRYEDAGILDKNRSKPGPQSTSLNNKLNLFGNKLTSAPAAKQRPTGSQQPPQAAGTLS